MRSGLVAGVCLDAGETTGINRRTDSALSSRSMDPFRELFEVGRVSEVCEQRLRLKWST
jgi:hypothetical protein